MRVSLKWLKTMVAVPDELDAFVVKLDTTGTAVDEVIATGNQMEGVVVGQILKKERHPNADTLWLTLVDVGDNNLDEQGQAEPLQIVCGAQNFEAGDKVPVAQVGTVLPDGNKIKKSKIRGLESRGMNCSARELGLGEDHAGIMILPADAPVGRAFADYIGASDTILDLEITSNRPDCMSMLGVAREVAAIYHTTYELGREFAQPVCKGKVEDLVEVSIADPTRCARYTACVIQGIKVGPSPQWLSERVMAAGARSINNIVDATNYIMFETGQPLHAFDLAKLTQDSSGKASIVVRAAADGEKFTTLDEIERTLTSDNTVIVDGNAASGQGETVALAGVMGGLASEVTDATVDILLEAAAFEPGSISRTSRNLKLASESSARFERGVDDVSCADSCLRAAALMAELGGGSVAQGVVDNYPAARVIPVLNLRLERLSSLLGAAIPREDVARILTDLGCKLDFGADDAQSCTVYPPSFRPDLAREIDLYEEVLRLWGMDKVQSQLPVASQHVGTRTPDQVLVEKIGLSLRAQGLNEATTFAFAAEKDMQLLGMTAAAGEEAVELINPINSDQTLLRMSLIPGLLHAVSFNHNHGVHDVQLYDMGTVFVTVEGLKQPRERPLLAAVLSGSWVKPGWNVSAQAIDFFDAKGIIENLARELCIADVRFVGLAAADAPWLAEGQAAEIRCGAQRLGWLGTIHPTAAAAFSADSPVIAFELEVEALLSCAQDVREFVAVPVYPAVELDLALVVDASLAAEELLQVARAAGGKLLAEVRVFDVFVDAEKLGAGKKSIALAFAYRSPERTLTSEEVEKLHAKVVRKLEAASGGTQRT